LAKHENSSIATEDFERVCYCAEHCCGWFPLWILQRQKGAECKCTL